MVYRALCRMLRRYGHRKAHFFIGHELRNWSLLECATWRRALHTFKHACHALKSMREKIPVLNCLSWRQLARLALAPVPLRNTLRCVSIGIQGIDGPESTTSQPALSESLKWFLLIFQTGLKRQNEHLCFSVDFGCPHPRRWHWGTNR